MTTKQILLGLMSAILHGQKQGYRTPNDSVLIANTTEVA